MTVEDIKASVADAANKAAAHVKQQLEGIGDGNKSVVVVPVIIPIVVVMNGCSFARPVNKTNIEE